MLGLGCRWGMEDAMRIRYCVAVSVIAFATPALAEVVGVTKSADQIVTGSVSGASRVVVTTAEIYENERLQANATGNAQIELRDGTKIVVGPNADVVVDNFVFNKDSNKVSELTIRATKGAFRFITGASDHSAYKIVTPYASIGVRGTAFDVTLANGGANIALLQGQITVCDRGGKCQRVDRSCTYTFVGGSGIEKPAAMVSAFQATRNRNLFPLLANQRGLRSEFQKFALSCGTAQLDIRDRSITNPQINVAPEVVGAIGNPPGGNPPGVDPPGVDPPAAEGVPNNPGNDKEVGNAGNNPNGNNGFGGEHGRSGSAPGQSGEHGNPHG